ncbi:MULTISPECIES: hypothetical protein [Pandoraea]|uniref:Uncharacterized protein n=2 Tax=Pandoraea TaxID=93217 RepID=A0A5E4UCB8_9BURK|nr:MULTISPECIES: hypothetical protein [Pandoraea]AJC15743.1 hypothetical protein NA29_06145 [Pandoraea sputorum]UVA79883.1 hypothetical protein NTU39_02275 [Pandoraea commovens]SNU81268.1 Uncharacterised protein [Pandoraea sputorum]VVD68521.1 hypothetical protein PSP20601_00472 [Pandoraea sputorum]VVD97192.1 hypothetical protein PCO31010_01956 [Pandoraea commovens]
MNRLAIVLDGLMLLYLAAATVVGVQSSAADGHELLTSVLGVLLALCVLAVIAAPFYVSLVVLVAQSERHLKLAAWLHRVLLTLMVALTLVSLLARDTIEVSAPLFVLVALVCVVNLVALSRRRTHFETFHLFEH